MPLLLIAPMQRNLAQIEKLMKEYNIKAAIHNHGATDKNFSHLMKLKYAGMVNLESEIEPENPRPG